MSWCKKSSFGAAFFVRRKLRMMCVIIISEETITTQKEDMMNYTEYKSIICSTPETQGLGYEIAFMWPNPGRLPIGVVSLNGCKDRSLPGIVNVSFEGVEGESLLLLLDDAGICASSGSACTSGSLDPSHVLLAIGLPHEVAHGSLRLSIGEYNTMAEIDHIIETVPKVVSYLRSMSPVWDELQKGQRPHLI